MYVTQSAKIQTIQTQNVTIACPMGARHQTRHLSPSFGLPIVASAGAWNSMWQSVRKGFESIRRARYIPSTRRWHVKWHVDDCMTGMDDLHKFPPVHSGHVLHIFFHLHLKSQGAFWIRHHDLHAPVSTTRVFSRVCLIPTCKSVFAYKAKPFFPGHGLFTHLKPKKYQRTT